MEKINRTKEEWKKELTPEEFQVMFEKETERPFTGEYLNNHEKGIYKCGACGLELFSSETKFDSGTGWPSFTDPVDLENINLVEDKSLGMTRIEVNCKRCGAHLGHVFDDLPRRSDAKAGDPENKGGKRYCINSCSLNLEKELK